MKNENIEKSKGFNNVTSPYKGNKGTWPAPNGPPPSTPNVTYPCKTAHGATLFQDFLPIVVKKKLFTHASTGRKAQFLKSAKDPQFKKISRTAARKGYAAARENFQIETALWGGRVRVLIPARPNNSAPTACTPISCAPCCFPRGLLLRSALSFLAFLFIRNRSTRGIHVLIHFF